MWLIYAPLLLCLRQMIAAEIGDTCELADGEKGKCRIVHKCPYAQDLLKKRIFPRLCGFEGKDTIVCCKKEKNQPYTKPGQISHENCMERYPEAENAVEVLVPGGKPSLVKEFPHMAAIGFGEKNSIRWQCGGSLISENFVLTAAHCLNSRELGAAKFVRLGDLDLSKDTDEAEPQDFTIKKTFPHPDYKNPSKYNDIALVQLDRDVTLTSYVGIACLDAERHHSEKSMIATGWGKTQFVGEYSSLLLKIDLDITDHDSCNKSFAGIPADELPNGIVDDMHICAGGKPDQDTCQGDSGGPLQIVATDRKNRFKKYNIVGVTSFGKACGISRSPGVYTRVFHYLSWIEKIVWGVQKPLRTIED